MVTRVSNQMQNQLPISIFVTIQLGFLSSLMCLGLLTVALSLVPAVLVLGREHKLTSIEISGRCSYIGGGVRRHLKDTKQ